MNHDMMSPVKPPAPAGGFRVDVAQMAERHPPTVDVAGSIPVIDSKPCWHPLAEDRNQNVGRRADHRGLTQLR